MKHEREAIGVAESKREERGREKRQRAERARKERHSISLLVISREIFGFVGKILF